MPRGTRKASIPPLSDDWPSVAAVTADAAEPAEAMPERQRIAKAMARAGLCSRRDAEAWILEGRVSVNGEVLASPARDVGPDDRVEIDGAPLPTPEKTRLFLFHKPRGLVTSDHDPEGRQTIFDHLHEHWPQGPRVVTVGRLDINTEGLLLLTNDGGLARMLELPKTGWLRRYRVRANGETDQAKLDALAAGIEIDGIEYAGIEAKLDRSQGANCWLTIGLREGKNREIKRVLEHLGLEVNRLIRLSFGPFQLLDLPEGEVEEVRTRVLKDQLGAALAAEAGVDFGETPAPAPLPARIERDKAAHGPKATREKTLSEKIVPEKIVRAERGAAPAREKRGRTGDPRPQQSRASERSGERPLRRREMPASGALEERARPRRHVSSLRTTEADAARAGPRKRVERTDTRDRNDRTVTVERKVSARPPGLSPSAEGKRARIARSGGARRKDGGRDETQRGDTGGARTRPAARDGERRDTRPARSSAGGDRPQRTRREDGDRAAPTRSRSPAGDGERRDTRPARSPASGDRPQRARREDGDRAAPTRSRNPAGGGERRDARPARSPAGSDRPQRTRREDGDRAAPTWSRSAAGGGERRDTRPARSSASSDRPPRARREDGERTAPRAERPARAGTRPPRRDDAKRDGASKTRGDRPRTNDYGRGAPEPGAATRLARGSGRASSGASDKSRPATGARPGGRPAGGGRPGGRPAGGGAPGRTKR